MNMYREVGKALSKTEYTILHGWQSLPDHHNSDLDIAINPKHLEILEKSLFDIESAKLVQMFQHQATCFHFILATKNGKGMTYLEIDAATDYRRDGLIYFSSEELNRARMKWKGFWVSSPETELAYLLVKKTLKGGMPVHQKKRLGYLIEDLGEISSTTISKELFGNKFGESLISWICKEKWDVLESNLPILKRALMFETIKRDPLNPLRYWINEVHRIIRRWLNPTGLIIAVLGPDGAGKSTLIHVLEEELSVAFRRVNTFHLRPGVLGKKAEDGPVTDPHGKSPRSSVFSVLKILYYFMDYTLGYLFKIYPSIVRSSLVIFDRFYDDIIVDPFRYRFRGPSWFVKLISNFIPRPSLYLVLDIPVDEILKRKQEIEEKELMRQRKAYVDLAVTLPNAYILDSGTTLERVKHEASEIITNHLHDRYVKRSKLFLSNDNIHKTLAWLTSVLSTNPRETYFTIKNNRNEDKRRVWETTCEFKYLPVNGGRAYLLPLKRKAAENSLMLYNVQSEKAKVIKAVMKNRYVSSLSSHLMKTVSVLTNRSFNKDEKNEASIFDYLKKLMNRSELDFAISLGTPGPHRKPVIQINDQNGLVVGYAKVGWNEVTNELVRNEANTIKKLSCTAFDSFNTPSVSYTGWWHDRYITILSSLEGCLLPASKTLNPKYMDALNDLAELNTKDMLVRESDFWAIILQRTKLVKSEYYRCMLEQKVTPRIEELCKNELFPFHMSHGDFTPWNTYIREDKLFLYDWEYARPYVPVGFDLFHFIFQTNVFLNKRNYHQLYKTFVEGSQNDLTKNYWEKFSISNRSVNLLLVLYLVDRFSFEASEGVESFQELNQLLKIILLMVDS